MWALKFYGKLRPSGQGSQGFAFGFNLGCNESFETMGGLSVMLFAVLRWGFPNLSSNKIRCLQYLNMKSLVVSALDTMQFADLCEVGHYKLCLLRQSLVMAVSSIASLGWKRSRDNSDGPQLLLSDYVGFCMTQAHITAAISSQRKRHPHAIPVPQRYRLLSQM